MVNTVTFPGLGLTLKLNRVAFSIFGHDIYWYGIIIACGFLLAVVWCCREGKRYGITQDNIIDMLIINVPLSIVGTRLYYIIFDYSVFTKTVDGVTKPDFIQMLRIWDGGLAIYGGVITAILVLLAFCKVKKINFLAFADLGVQGLLIGQLVGRWGNFVNVEAYGGQTDLPWRMGVEEAGQLIYVHPTFFYESMWNLIGFLLIVFLVRKLRRYDGQVFLFYLFWYGLGRGMIEGLRTDSLYFFGLTFFGVPIRTSQMVALASMAVALVLLIVNARRHHDPQALYVNRVKTAAHAGKSEEESNGSDHT